MRTIVYYDDPRYDFAQYAHAFVWTNPDGSTARYQEMPLSPRIYDDSEPPCYRMREARFLHQSIIDEVLK